jgi:hypothetical protein
MLPQQNQLATLQQYLQDNSSSSTLFRQQDTSYAVALQTTQ